MPGFYDYVDDILKAHGQLSVSWMGIPSFGRMHTPSLDEFMEVMEPEGIFLWIDTESEEEELDLLNRISKWT